MKSARKSLLLVDNWATVETLDMLAAKQKGVAVTVVTSEHRDRKGNPRPKILPADIAKFNAQYPSLSLRFRENFHDRFLVVDVKAVCLHRFGGIVSASTDNLVLSAALGLVAVAAYGNYFYVVTSVVAFVYAIHSSMTAGFGNKIHVEGRAATLGSFLRANRLVLAAVAWCAAMMLALYQPFVRVWTRDDPALVRHAATPLLCVVAIEIPWEARAVFGPFFGKGAAPGYWRQQAHFALFAVALCAATWGCARLVPLSGFAGLLAKAAAAAAFSGAAVLALFRRDLAAAFRSRKGRTA